MRFAHTDSELAGLVDRYVSPDRRYLRLGGGLVKMDEPERREFLRALAIAAAEATVTELSVLPEGGWRERKTAAWLIAVAARTEFRDRIGELLLAGEVCFAGRGYAVALASFGTEADAQWLAAYLDRYLPRLDLFYDQAMTLGALLHVDDGLGTDHAARFLEPGGLMRLSEMACSCSG